MLKRLILHWYRWHLYELLQKWAMFWLVIEAKTFTTQINAFEPDFKNCWMVEFRRDQWWPSYLTILLQQSCQESVGQGHIQTPCEYLPVHIFFLITSKITRFLCSSDIELNSIFLSITFFFPEMEKNTVKQWRWLAAFDLTKWKNTMVEFFLPFFSEEIITKSFVLSSFYILSMFFFFFLKIFVTYIIGIIWKKNHLLKKTTKVI